MLSFLVTRRPKSYNGWRKSDAKSQAFLKAVTDSFVAAYPKHEKLTGDLYGVIYYFYKDSKDHDADNISKPVWDCLTNVVYVDDRQIRLRIAGILDLGSQDIQQLNLTKIPSSVFNELMDALDRHAHFFYVECGSLKLDNYNWNLEINED